MLKKPATPLQFNRILLTGAAGNLGQVLRPRLKAYCNVLRVSDQADIGAPGAGEEVMRVALEDADAVIALLHGVDAVVHMGGVSTEQPWEPILAGNIMGMVNLYEAARKAGTKRIIFASSNHATGFYKQSETITPNAQPKPDGFYGLFKAFTKSVHLVVGQAHARGSHVAPVARKQIPTGIDRFIQIESGNAAGAAGGFIAGTGEYDGGSVISFDESGSDDSYDALVPIGLKNY